MLKTGKYFRVFGFLFVYILLFPMQISCAQTIDPNINKTIPVPSVAYDVSRYSLESESAYQLDFKIDVPYPDTNTIKFYSDFYKAKNWSVCENDNTWNDYNKRIDKNTDIPTRQKLQYLASSEKKKLLLVALRYFGSQVANTNKIRKWDTDVQHVTVTLYDLRNNGFEKTISLLALSCK